MEHKNGDLKANKRMQDKTPSPKRRANQTDPLAAKEDELKKAQKKIKQLERALDNKTEELDLLKKAERFLAQKKVIFAFIDKNRAGHSVELLCKLYGVSKSGFYAWKTDQ